MGRPKYHLEALVQLRDGRLRKAACDLSAATDDREAATLAQADAALRRAEHEQGVERVCVAETEALVRGELRVRDLAQTHAWGLRVSAERKMLVEEVERANAIAAGAREREECARGSLTLRRAECEAIAKHRTRWRQAQRTRAEAIEEEALSEAWRPKR